MGSHPGRARDRSPSGPNTVTRGQCAAIQIRPDAPRLTLIGSFQYPDFTPRNQDPFMNPIRFALRHPITVMVAKAALVAGSGLAARRILLTGNRFHMQSIKSSRLAWSLVVI